MAEDGRRIGRHCQIRVSHARRPWKKRKKGREEGRSGKTKTVVKKGRTRRRKKGKRAEG